MNTSDLNNLNVYRRWAAASGDRKDFTGEDIKYLLGVIDALESNLGGAKVLLRQVTDLPITSLMVQFAGTGGVAEIRKDEHRAARFKAEVARIDALQVEISHFLD